MIVNTYRTFGYTIQSFLFDDKEQYTTTFPVGRKWFNYCTRGSLDLFSIPANKEIELQVQTGSWLGPDEFSTYSGQTRHTSTGETLIWSIQQDLNNGYLPDCEKWHLVKGESKVLPTKTKLFFCAGELNLEDKVIIDPIQIKVVTKDVTVTANQDCYGIIFT